MNGKRESRKSVLAAQYDDDDDVFEPLIRQKELTKRSKIYTFAFENESNEFACETVKVDLCFMAFS